jgi:hypothetical protein
VNCCTRQGAAREVDLQHKQLALEGDMMQKRLEQQQKQLDQEHSKESREEIMQMTRVYVDGGMKPVDARKRARQDVLGDE